MTNRNTINQTSVATETQSTVASLQQGAGYARPMVVASPAPCTSAQFVETATAITTPPVRILRLPEVMTRVGLKRASIYQHMAAGAFPKQIALGVRAVGWLESEIDTWLSDRIQERRFTQA